MRKAPDCVSVFILLYCDSRNTQRGILSHEYYGLSGGKRGQRHVFSAGGGGTRTLEFFISESFQMEGLTELIVTKDIPERRTKMIELGDAFIAFPGGTGTLEEVSEVMSKLALKQIDAPCVLYNLNGYYEGLKALLRHMVEMGLSTEEKQEKVYFAENLGDIKAILGAEK